MGSLPKRFVTFDCYRSPVFTFAQIEPCLNLA